MLASGLEKRRWTVWWDRKIIVGEPFDEVIEHELEDAKSVIALWSTHSIRSEWVKNEAAFASERGVLIPIRIDKVQPPLEFRRKQTVDLIGWTGSNQLDGFEKLCHALSFLTAKEASSQTPSAPKAAPGFRWGQLLVIGAVAAVSILATTMLLSQRAEVARSDIRETEPASRQQATPEMQLALLPPRRRAQGKEIEPNDNYDQANRISVGDSISGFFNHSSPDWIAIKVDRNEAFLYIKIRNTGGQFCGVKFFSAEEKRIISGTFPYGKDTAEVYRAPINGTDGIFVALFARQVNGSCGYEVFTSYSPL